MKKQLLVLLFLLAASHLSLADSFEFNQQCMTAYQHIIALRFQEGEALLKAEANNNSRNTCPQLLYNYIDFLKLFISEDAEMFERLEPNRKDRIKILENLDDANPYKRIAIAAIKMQWAFVRLKFGEQYTTAALDIYQSFLLIDENTELFPDFHPNLLSNGIMHAMVGAVPPRFQWMLKLVSLSGTIQQGRSELYQLLALTEKDPSMAYLRDETLFYLSFIELNLQSDLDHATSLLQHFKLEDRQSKLLVFAQASIQMRVGENDQALQLLKNAQSLRNGYRFDYMKYLQAEAMLRKLDFGAAGEYVFFLQNFKGHNYRADALRKMAWISALQSDTAAYFDMMKLVAGQDGGQVDADKQARREAELKTFPNILLLKARLLFDGGYYRQAADLLADTSNAHLDPTEKVEYIYRKGRIAHAQQDFQKALNFYHLTINQGRSNPAYFAANAALKSGEIHESLHDTLLAEKYYRLCLDIDPDEYGNSIHQKAQSGLDRLGKK